MLLYPSYIVFYGYSIWRDYMLLFWAYALTTCYMLQRCATVTGNDDSRIKMGIIS